MKKTWKREWNIEFQTVLGNLVGDREPTERQIQYAKIEADKHIAKLIEEEEANESLARWIKKQKP